MWLIRGGGPPIGTIDHRDGAIRAEDRLQTSRINLIADSSGRLRPRGEVATSGIGHTCEHMRSAVQGVDYARAATPYMGRRESFLTPVVRTGAPQLNRRRSLPACGDGKLTEARRSVGSR